MTDRCIERLSYGKTSPRAARLASYALRRRLIRALGELVEHRRDGFEIRVAEFRVRLQVHSFGPLIPGVDEDDALFVMLVQDALGHVES